MTFEDIVIAGIFFVIIAFIALIVNAQEEKVNKHGQHNS